MSSCQHLKCMAASNVDHGWPCLHEPAPAGNAEAVKPNHPEILSPPCVCGRGYYDLVHWPSDCHEYVARGVGGGDE